jgi:anti-sigma factor RsiW
MKCDRVRPYVESYADGELPAWRRLLLRRHLIACPACAARLEETLLLRDRIRTEIPRFAAPESLRARVMALAGEPSSRASSRSRPDYRWRWTAAGALAGSVLTMFVLFASNAILDRRSNEDLASVAVTAHVRATLGNQLIQVASSDQHTVKPWLSARLDYSPPVRDLASDGFPLVGARIEYLDGRPVAVLAYRYREHTVDVFVRPNASHFGVFEPRTIRGFHVLRAEGQGMDWVAVSDAATEALAPLMRRLAEGG